MSLTLVTRWSVVVRCLFCYSSKDDRCTRDPNVWFEPSSPLPKGPPAPPPSVKQPAALLALDRGVNMGLLPGGRENDFGDIPLPPTTSWVVCHTTCVWALYYIYPRLARGSIQLFLCKTGHLKTTCRPDWRTTPYQANTR
jgi:hypothetical protein